MSKENSLTFQHSVLAWYDVSKRDLPWRKLSDPYPIWISEIMLQQTTVRTVIPYFKGFMKKWPTLYALAQAPLNDILHHWQGLGYYGRAKNLHRCAQLLCAEHQGIFPQDLLNLRKLPGIGPYTAAAISCIAFQKAEIVIDGNIQRIMARLFTLKTEGTALKKDLLQKASTFLLPHVRPGDYVQALMDLGAQICTPQQPKCTECPVQNFCQGRLDSPELYPVKKTVRKPHRKTIFLWIENKDGEVFFEKRPDQGLFSHMLTLPARTHWDTKQNAPQINYLPLKTKALKGSITHAFTHFTLQACLEESFCAETASYEGIWQHPSQFSQLPLPTLIKKVMRLKIQK